MTERDLDQDMRDVLRILPPKDAVRGMTEKEISSCLDEVADLRVCAAMLRMFESGQMVPRVIKRKVHWCLREKDPLMPKPS